MAEHPKNNPERGPSRRDFLRLASGTLGGALLTGAGIGCGGSIDLVSGGSGGLNNSVGHGIMPNGYVFFRVLTPQ
ncbi:MAG: hypothetical protein ACAH95_12045, partial [Fimbriimonas sp.]